MELLTLWHIAGVLLISCLWGARGQDGQTEDSSLDCFDYNHVYEGVEISRVHENTVEECRARCEALSRCTFFVYYTLTSICVLKEGELYKGRRRKTNVIAGPPKCDTCGVPGIAYSGTPSEVVKAHTLLHCQLLCVSSAECKFFTYDKESKDCSHFSEESPAVEAATKVSGEKECAGPPTGVTMDAPLDMPTCAVKGVKYQGQALSVVISENANECANACSLSPTCEAYRYNTENHECAMGLALFESRKKADKSYISGPKYCLRVKECRDTDVEYDGERLDGVTGDFAIVEECQLRCRATLDCRRWTYDLSSRSCTLFKDPIQKKSAPGKISGPKICAGDCDAPFRKCTPPAFAIMRSSRLPGVEECREECMKDPSCKVFTYSKDGTCELKDETCVASVTPDDDVYTGLKTCSLCVKGGVGLKTEGALLWASNSENAEECRIRCAMMENCTRYFFEASLGKCSFLSGETQEIHGDTFQSGPPLCTPETSCILDNVEWRSNTNLHVVEDVDAPQCQELCAVTPACRFFTLEESTRKCYLKAADEKDPIVPVSRAGWKSGNKKCAKLFGPCEEDNMDYPLEDLYEKQLHTADTHECWTACYREPRCRLYTVNHRESNCWLKKATAILNRKKVRDASSGTRLGCPKCLRHSAVLEGEVIEKTRSAVSAHHCQLLCEANSKCKFFNYRENRDCELLSSMKKEVPAHMNNMIGPRAC